VTQKLITDGARRAVQKLKRGDVAEPFILDTPILVTVDFMNSSMADYAMRVPGSQRDDTRVSVEAPDMASAYMTFRTLVGMASLP
jgi:D-aminopeptidase